MRSSMRSPAGTSFSVTPGCGSPSSPVRDVFQYTATPVAVVSVIPHPVPKGKSSPISCTASRCMRSQVCCGSKAPPYPKPAHVLEETAPQFGVALERRGQRAEGRGHAAKTGGRDFPQIFDGRIEQAGNRPAGVDVQRPGHATVCR